MIYCGDCVGVLLKDCHHKPLKKKRRKPKKVKRKILFTGGGVRTTKWACGCTFECSC